jgi:SAM-dependent methyltransferase
LLPARPPNELHQKVNNVLVQALRNYVGKLVRKARRQASSTMRRTALTWNALRHRAVRRVGSILDTLETTRTCPACHSRSVQSFGVPVGKQLVERGIPRRNWLVGCVTCGLVFTSVRPTEGAVEAYYADNGEWVESRRRKQQVAHSLVSNEVFEVVAAAADLTHPPADPRVFDIGCGNGAWLNSLARHGWKTFGLEPSTRMAFERHQELTTIPTDDAFALVILNHVLEHLIDPGAMLTAAASVVRDGGLLFISVPSLDRLPVHGDFHYCINARYHLQAFTEACLRALLNRAGFVDVVRVAEPGGPSVDRAGKQLRIVARRARATANAPAIAGNPLDAARRALHAAGVLDRRAS